MIEGQEEEHPSLLYVHNSQKTASPRAEPRWWCHQQWTLGVGYVSESTLQAAADAGIDVESP